MVEKFNPYREWLGIPESQLPANHYRLLGVEVFETDVGVISHAADKQMAFLRTFQTGKYSEESQKLLNEVSLARVCLLNPEHKSAYDASLRRAVVRPVPVPPPASVPVQVSVPKPIPVEVPTPAPVISTRSKSYRRKKRSSNSSVLWYVAAGFGLLILWLLLMQ